MLFINPVLAFLLWISDILLLVFKLESDDMGVLLSRQSDVELSKQGSFLAQKFDNWFTGGKGGVPNLDTPIEAKLSKALTSGSR